MRLALSLFLFPTFLFAQNLDYARQVVDTLAAPAMHGRGYVQEGDRKAADYIQKEFQRLGLVQFRGGYIQGFNTSVNTFPGKMEVSVNGKALVPGKDFLYDASGPPLSGTFKVKHIDKKKSKYEHQPCDFGEQVLLTHSRQSFVHSCKAKAILQVEEKKLTHRVSMQQRTQPVITVMQDALPRKVKKITVEVENEFKDIYPTQNVLAFLPGTTYPDSFVVISAHYDHLGRMGKDTYFPGANDNASGTALLLNLAEHFAKEENRLKYSIAFIAFGGEELGLLGSKYFVENPLFPLDKIKFVINMDIMGTGDEGITVVNATKHLEAYEQMVRLNDLKKYLALVKKRGPTKNSDHYFFSEAGVPAFFIYTMGGIKAYHDIYDKRETLPLTKFKEVFQLLVDFTETL